VVVDGARRQHTNIGDFCQVFGEESRKEFCAAVDLAAVPLYHYRY
jgi:hypothetical protein